METIKKAVLIAAVLLIVPMLSTAMGNSDKAYGEVLEETFTAIAEELEAGEIDVKAAVDQLHELRTENGRENNGDYQAMEKILEAVQEREMTSTRARLQLCELDESETGLSEAQLKTRSRVMNQIRVSENSEGSSDAGAGTGMGSGTGEDKTGSTENSNSGQGGTESSGSSNGKK